jgi:hypothetical protein
MESAYLQGTPSGAVFAHEKSRLVPETFQEPPSLYSRLQAAGERKMGLI